VKDSVLTTNSGQMDVTLQNASTHSLRTGNSESSALKLSADITFSMFLIDN